MLTVVVRTLIVYVVVIALLRLMGKRQLGELQPSELVTTILVSNLASLPVEDTELPILSSLIPIFLIVSLEIVLSVCEVRSQRVSALVSGRPKIVIQDGVVDQAALRQLRFGIDDLLEALRNKDVFDLREVALGIVETNGTLNIYKRFQNRAAENGGLGLKSTALDRPPIALVLDGEVQEDGLGLCAMTPAELRRRLEEMQLEPQSLFLLQLDSSGQLLAVKKEAEK